MAGMFGHRKTTTRPSDAGAFMAKLFLESDPTSLSGVWDTRSARLGWTKLDFNTALSTYAKTFGVDLARALLQRHVGTMNYGDVPGHKYGAVIAAIAKEFMGAPKVKRPLEGA